VRVLVAGGTGFVGRHVAEALRERGHRVVVLSRGRRAACLDHSPITLASSTSSGQSLPDRFVQIDYRANISPGETVSELDVWVVDGQRNERSSSFQPDCFVLCPETFEQFRYINRIQRGRMTVNENSQNFTCLVHSDARIPQFS